MMIEMIRVEIVHSVNKVPIRLTTERWLHITEEHCELAGWREEVLETVAFPTRIFAGGSRELLAVREIQPGRHLVVVYREGAADGFIITAFITSKTAALERRKQLWP
jgi:hypothetical protein